MESRITIEDMVNSKAIHPQTDMSDGKTVAEAIENCEIIIQEWIETAEERGQEIPEPRGKLMYA